MKAPLFWYQPFSFFAALLWPLSVAYKMSFSLYRSFKVPQSIDIPVICVGNLVVGGMGKTPCVTALARLLQQKGYHVHLLSRGYLGQLKGPVLVDCHRHTPLEVGDEPLLLAKIAPTWVAKNRLQGARAAQQAGAEVVLMDDGLQNFDLKKDFTILVVDPNLWFGNGLMLPAGPLREPISQGLKKVQAIFMVSKEHTSQRETDKKTFQVLTQPCKDDLQPLFGQKLIAFSGIAHPQKFYDTLKMAGLEIMKTVDFEDHHLFTNKELNDLWNDAQQTHAQLVTTEKDWVRLEASWQKKVYCLRITNVITQEEEFFSQLKPILKRGQE